MKNKIYLVMMLMVLMTSCNEEYVLDGLEYPTCENKMVLQGYIFSDGGVEATVSHTVPYRDMTSSKAEENTSQNVNNTDDASIFDACLYLCEDGKEVVKVPYIEGINYKLEAGAWNIDKNKAYSLKVVSNMYGTATSEPCLMPCDVNIESLEGCCVEEYRYYCSCDVSFVNDEPSQSYMVKMTPYNNGRQQADSSIRRPVSVDEVGVSTVSGFMWCQGDSVGVEVWHIDGRYRLYKDALDKYTDSFSNGSAGVISAPDGNVDGALGVVFNASRVTAMAKLEQKKM